MPLVACQECDLLHRLTPESAAGEARCTRCGARLQRRQPAGGHSVALALVLTAAVLFVIANAFPIVTLEAQGIRNASTLLGAVQTLWAEQRRTVAAMVFVTTFLVPMIELLGLGFVLLALQRRRPMPGLAAMLHLLDAVKPWGMVEVFFLGVLVSLVKLAHVASIEAGAGLFSFGALMLVLAAAASAFDPDAAWARLAVRR